VDPYKGSTNVFHSSPSLTRGNVDPYRGQTSFSQDDDESLTRGPVQSHRNHGKSFLPKESLTRGHAAPYRER
jgi:hypothetical protein